MSGLTIIVGLVLLVATFSGWRSGLVKRILELGGLAVAVILAARYGTTVGLAIAGATDIPAPVAGGMGWLSVIALGFIVSRFLAWAVSKVINMTILGWVDRTGGALFGLGVGTLIMSVLLVLASSVPDNNEMRRQIKDEPLPRLVHGVAPALWKTVNGRDHDLDRLWDDARETARDLGEDAAEAAGRAAAGLQDSEGQ